MVLYIIFGVLLLLLLLPIQLYICVFVDLQKVQASTHIYLYNLIKVFDDDAEVENGKIVLHGTIEQSISFEDIKSIKKYLYLLKSFSIRKILVNLNIGSKINSTTAIGVVSAADIVFNTLKCAVGDLQLRKIELYTNYTLDTGLAAVVDVKVFTNFLLIIANTIANAGGKIWKKIRKAKTK